jgi:hypothetical protein
MRQLIKKMLNCALKRFGAEIVPTQILYPWQKNIIFLPSFNQFPLPKDAAEYLTTNNPKLIDLQQRYKAFDPAVTTPLVWTDSHIRPEYISHFRGDNAWVWQLRGAGANILSYAITYYYLKSIDRLGLFDKLTEDNNFGNFSFTIDGRQISRDLLDSIAEIYFLDKHFNIASRSDIRILDVGAGYGRLAYRVLSAFPQIESFSCTDAVAASTFVSDYYLRFRGLKNAQAIPLDQIDNMLRDHPVDFAMNIHSFSECRLEAIEWWVRLLSKHRVKHLVIAPNGDTRYLRTNDGQDFLPILERYGYKFITKEPKYLDPVVQEYGLMPTWYHLLELKR